MSDTVHFMLVSDKDMADTCVAKQIDSFHIYTCWFGSLDTSRYFTSEPRGIYNPVNQPWFVFDVRWTATGYEDIDRAEKIATNGIEWTYVKQNLGYTRVPFTDEVKKKLLRYIEKFWKKQ